MIDQSLVQKSLLTTFAGLLIMLVGAAGFDSRLTEPAGAFMLVGAIVYGVLFCTLFKWFRH